MWIKVNQDLLLLDGKKIKKDTELKIQDNQGIPVNIFWRNRLKDSISDNCISVISGENKKETNKEKK